MLICAYLPVATSLFWLSFTESLPPQHDTAIAVHDAATGRGVPYASVGVQGKPIGTVADARGHFAAAHLAAATATDTVVVSCVGYRPYKLLAAELHQHPTLLLVPQPQLLGEARVRATSWKRHRLGRDGAGGITYYNFHLATDQTTASIPGREVGTILHVKPGSYLEDAHVFLGQRNYRNLRFRLNVRALDANDHPAASLLTHDIQFAVANDARGWQHIDLQPYDVCVGNNKRVAVTIEWLDGIEDRNMAGSTAWNKLLIPAAMSATHRMVFREISEAEWQVQPLNLSLYVTAVRPRE